MFDFKIIINTGVPDNAEVTPSVLQKCVLAVIKRDGGEVWVGRKKIREYKHSENALIKHTKVFAEERSKSRRIYKIIKGNKKLFIRAKKNFVEDQIGFDNVI